MSRPPANNFATFFPSAPSVVHQSKSSKSFEVDSSTPRRSDEYSGDAPYSNHARNPDITSAVGTSRLPTKHISAQRLDDNKYSTEDGDPYSGDILHALGSASSSSAASSVFSNAAVNSTMASANGLHFTTLTPLTNSDSSPRAKFMSPALESNNHGAMVNGRVDSSVPPETMTPLHTPPTHRRCARDPDLNVKGTKCTYDPELDKNLSSKDKRKLKAQFDEFGTLPEHNVAPPDPRLATPNYSKGVMGKGKAKFRPAPYNLKPWPADATTMIAPAPATAVVVTGFDPMAPLAQILALFSSYGEIGDTDNKTDPATGRFLGICNVRYQDCPSFQGGGPISAVLAAKTAYLEGKRGQRIGLKTVRVELDRDGSVTEKLVERAITVQRKESGFGAPKRPPPPPSPSTPVAPSTPQLPGFPKSTGPPPTAPKGPAARAGGKPPPSSVAAPYRESSRPERVKSDRPSQVETDPIMVEMKNQPFIFIAHAHVPVLPTTIPHLKKRLRMYDWRDIRCDETGYFITFEHSRIGQTEAKKMFQGAHMHPLFTYTMTMELYLNGDPKYAGPPVTELPASLPSRPAVIAAAPAPAPAPTTYIASRHQLRQRREHDADLEEEKRQRARDLDPSRAVVQLVIQELRDKLIEDVKSRIAAKVLYDYLDPKRHAEKRRRLGIDDPEGSRRPAYGLRDGGALTPDSRFGSHRRPLGNKNMTINTLPKIGKRAGVDAMAGFRDERRQVRAPRQFVRPLFHQLSQFQDEDDSDDDLHTSVTRDTEDLESRPPSRMSMTSVSDNEDELLRKITKRRMHAREESEMGDSLIKDEKDRKASAEDLIIAKLERNLYEMSPSSRKRKRIIQALEQRKRQKADDELFGVDKAELDRELSVDVKVDESETPAEATPDVEPDILKPAAKKPKPKKKSKKQIAEEREALRQAEAEAEAEQVVDDVMELAAEEEALAEEAERRPVVEWGVSAEQPEPTVDDDEDILPDLRGWQASLFDEEDIELLSDVLKGRTPMDIGDTTAWAWRQEQIKSLRRGPQAGALRKEPVIGGYFVPNPTGSARTEPVKKILEVEKSKYLPHRIRVQKDRERRQLAAERLKKDPTAKAVVEVAKTSSRGKRADDRRTVKDLDRQREMLQGMGEDADVLRFNQLQKRKKPVKFARSAIHNWGLYSLEHIQTGEMIIEYVGEKIRQEIADLREIKYTESGIGSSYLFRIDEGNVVDATKKGGIARFINHSCDPNCTAKIIRVGGSKRIVIYALADIEKGKSPCLC